MLRKCLLRVFPVFIFLPAALCAYGQDAGQPCTPGLRMFGGFGGMSRKALPYSAVVKSTFEQKLPDGNTIRSVTRTRDARTSEGATMQQRPQSCEFGLDGQLHERVFVSLFSLPDGSWMYWEAGQGAPKTAHRTVRRDRPVAAPSAEEIAERQKLASLRRPSREEWKSEDLGTKTIAGVSARGHRSTRTIPAGEEGNDLPLVVVNETWDSVQLGLMLQRIEEDPRRGRTVSEVEELRLGEPDAAVFAPPQGYTVVETKQEEVVVAKP